MAEPESQDQKYKSIAEQILNLKGTLPNNIIKILEELAQRKDPSSVLMGLRLYLRANGKPATDLGFMEIAQEFVDKEFKPGDFVLFSYVQKIRRDDTLTVLFKNSDGTPAPAFRKVSEVLPDNKVQVEGEGGIGRIIPRDDILAKVARVISFASKEWNELATEIAYKVQLQQMLVDVRKVEGLDEGQKKEIDKRLAYLNR